MNRDIREKQLKIYKKRSRGGYCTRDLYSFFSSIVPIWAPDKQDFAEIFDNKARKFIFSLKKLQYSTTMLSYVHSTVQFTVDKQLRNLKQIVQGVNLVYAAWRSRNVLSKQNGVGLRGLPVPTINMHESYT